METLTHVLLRCRKTRLVWYFCPLRIDVSSFTDADFKSLLAHFWMSSSTDFISLFCILAWIIWSARNQVYFGGGDFCVSSIIQKTLAFHLNFKDVSTKPPAVYKIRAEARWNAPQGGTLKVNSDAAVFKDGCIGLGFVVRNHNGEIVLAGCKKIWSKGSSTLAEGLAMRWALQQTMQKNLRGLCAESDSSILINGINGMGVQEIYSVKIVEDILSIAHEVNCTIFTHVSRSANTMAHLLAHFEVGIDSEHV